MAKKVGTLIKEARTSAGLTQTALASKIKTLTAADISKAERGEKELTTDQLKEIAKITGVTQKSLLDAAKGTASTAKKTASGKTSSAKASSAGTTMKVSASEKKLLDAYRTADTDTKKAVAALLLKGEAQTGSLLNGILGNKETGKVVEGIIGNLLGGKK